MPPYPSALSLAVREVYKRKETAFANTACDLKFLTLADLQMLCSDFQVGVISSQPPQHQPPTAPTAATATQ